jgi:hypothetical protein
MIDTVSRAFQAVPFHIKICLKIQTRLSEAINRRLTNITMAKRKDGKRTTRIPQENSGVTPGALEGYTVPTSLVVLVILY